MSAGAQARSAIGVIISGRCRDLAEHHELGFPVFARGRSTLGQSPFTRPSEINIPLLFYPSDQGTVVEGNRFPPTRVEPGDWMIADRDGVVCVPHDLEAQVIELAAKGRVIDSLCMEDIKAGKGIQASFKTHRGK
jgi:regulator of RNase E activity RraA